MLDYQNKKLESLKLYPPFNEDVFLFRNKYGIEENGILNEQKHINENNEETVINLYAYSTGYKQLSFYNIFYEEIDRLFNEYCIDKSSSNFIFFAFYLVFDRVAMQNDIDCILKDKYLSEIYYNDFNMTQQNLSQLLRIEEFQYDIKSIRNNLGIKRNDCISNVGNNYNCFYKYLCMFSIFHLDAFLKDIYTLINRYEILSCYNKWDYKLIYNYILFNLSLTYSESCETYQEIDNEVAISNDLLKYLDDNNLVNFYKGRDLKFESIDSKKLYIELPSFVHKKYFDVIFKDIKLKIEQYYGTTFVNNKIQIENYYRNKYVYEIKEEIQLQECEYGIYYNIMKRIVENYTDEMISKAGYSKLEEQFRYGYKNNEVYKDLLRSNIKWYENNKNLFVKENL